MASEQFNQVAQQVIALPQAERQALIALLQAELEAQPVPSLAMVNGVHNLGASEVREKRLQWLKENREQYAGQYVAFAEAVMIEHGTHITEVRNACLARGVNDPLIVFLFSTDSLPFAGW